MSMSHEIIVNKVLNDYKYGDVYKLRKNHNGTAKLKNGQTIKYGLGRGTGDIVGYAVGNARHIEIEVKTDQYDKLSPEQKQHLLTVKFDGGLSYIARQIFTDQMYELIDIEDYINDISN